MEYHYDSQNYHDWGSTVSINVFSCFYSYFCLKSRYSINTLAVLYNLSKDSLVVVCKCVIYSIEFVTFARDFISPF